MKLSFNFLLEARYSYIKPVDFVGFGGEIIMDLEKFVCRNFELRYLYV